MKLLSMHYKKSHSWLFYEVGGGGGGRLFNRVICYRGLRCNEFLLNY